MKRSLWLGASLAPLTAPVIYMVIVALTPDHTPKQERTGEVMFIGLALLIGFNYIVSFVLGIPLVKILRRSERLSFWWAVLLASPLGTIVFGALMLVVIASGETIRWDGVLFFLLTGAAFGFVTAAVFCVLAGIRVTPDGRGKHHRAA